MRYVQALSKRIGLLRIRERVLIRKINIIERARGQNARQLLALRVAIENTAFEKYLSVHIER